MLSRYRSDTEPHPIALSFLRRLLWLFLLGLALMLAILWGLEHDRIDKWLSKMTWLQLAEIKITAEWPLTAEKVRQMLPPLEGKNLVLVNARGLITLLESKPWIETVTIKKEYPNRLLIDVGSRRARAIFMRRGQPEFIDAAGRVIERVTPAVIRGMDLPIVTHDSAEAAAEWDMPRMLGVLDRVARALEPDYRVSELNLQTPPYFRFFLEPDRIEVLFQLENWSEQLPRLVLLLRDGPGGLIPGKTPSRRINLIFTKKTIVSAPLSN